MWQLLFCRRKNMCMRVSTTQHSCNLSTATYALSTTAVLGDTIPISIPNLTNSGIARNSRHYSRTRMHLAASCMIDIASLLMTTPIQIPFLSLTAVAQNLA